MRSVPADVPGVLVIIRRGSPTFARWADVTLSADNFRQC
jgi:dTDP-4-dehydrorhamnose 3,5-epimerase-like enzyme